MEEYANKFLELLRYVKYIKYEKVNIQCFLSGLPQSYKDSFMHVVLAGSIRDRTHDR